MAYSHLRDDHSDELGEPEIRSGKPDHHGFIGGPHDNSNGKTWVSSKVLERREIKWRHMLNESEHFNIKLNHPKLKKRCYKGIPPTVRPQAWFHLCRGQVSKGIAPHLYEDLIKRDGYQIYTESIKKDLHLQFPHHIRFCENSTGREELFQILKAYSIMNEEVGYCQAQAPVAAFLLIQMPAEDAFRCFSFLCDKFLYGYYMRREQALSRHGNTLMILLKKFSRKAHKHLMMQQIEPTMYLMEWFPCVFTRVLPWDTLLRVWDVFLYEGVKVLFKVALVLLKECLESSYWRKTCPTAVKTLQLLKNPPHYIMEEGNLICQIKKLNLKDEDISCETFRQ